MRVLATVAILAVTCLVAPVHAAIYAGWGTLAFNRPGPDFSLCFAGDSADTRPDRALVVFDHIRHIEWAANIRFHPPGNPSLRLQSGAPLRPVEWKCPDTAPVNGVLPQSDLGDIRILLDTPANAAWFRAPLVGGDGCAIDNRPANWGVIANEPVLSKWCHFNMKLSDVMLPGTREYALNLTLHEFGHRLGLEHEHDRADAPCFKGQMANSAPVTMADVRGTVITSGPMLFMTAFDRRSVMMYTLPACDAPGSVAATGFSDLDRLALRILYPERVRVAEVAGVRVVPVGTSIALDSLWKTLGAVVTETGPSVAAKFEWTVDGIRRAATSGLTLTLGEGRHRVQYAFEDFRGRSYSSDTTVEVLSAAQFTRRMASQAALNGMQ